MKTLITINNKSYELEKLNNRRLYKLLRTEGLLPAESVGRTSSEVLECGSIKVYYKDIELFIGVENKEDNMKNVNELCLFIQPQAELEAYEKELAMYRKLTDGKCHWDDVENYLMLEGTPKHIEIDKDGHEVDAHKKINYPVIVEYTPDEYAEYFSTDQNGDPRMGSVGDAELIKYPVKEAVYSKDIGDKENEERGKPVFTRKNTISEEESMNNLIIYMKRLEEVTTYEELRELQKEVYELQNEHKWSLWFFFPKGGSKAFWTAYRTKKAIMLTEMEVNMENDVKLVEKYIEQLKSVTDYKELGELREAVFNMNYSPVTQEIKSKFWADYKVKKAELNTNKAEFYKNQREQVFTEVVGLIKETEDQRMLNLIKKDVWKARLPQLVKKALIKKIEMKQDGQKVGFDMDKAFTFMHAEADKEYKTYIAKTYGKAA